jgi:hypothetical protein
MWNKISGSIPKEIGNIKSLFLLYVLIPLKNEELRPVHAFSSI